MDIDRNHFKMRNSAINTKINKHSFENDKKSQEEGLTMYFEELAGKALELTRKYGLKEEFDIIRQELHKTVESDSDNESPFSNSRSRTRSKDRTHTEMDHYHNTTKQSKRARRKKK